MTGFAPRIDMLPPAQAALWPALAPAAGLGFALYGGTAIALRLGHRISEDFDLFAAGPLDADALRRACPFVADRPALREDADSLVVRTAGGVLLSFFGGIDFGRVGAPDIAPENGLPVASALDLLATKLKTILQRAAAKDYIDIAALLRSGLELERGLAGARTLFGPGYPPMEAVRALCWFGDGDLETLGAEDRRILVEAAAALGDRPLPTAPLLSRSLAGGG